MDERRKLSAPIARWYWLGLAVLALTMSCQPPPEQPALPRGPLIAGDARALERILDSLEQLEATPLAREASEARAAIAACDEFATGHKRPDTRLFEGDVCRRGQALPPALEELRADAPLVFVLPLGEQGDPAKVDSEPRLIGRIQLDETGSVRIEARVEPLPVASWAKLLLPAFEPPGPTRLSSRDALVQGRLRPLAGLDLAAWVPAGSQADSMFRLKSELFAGAALGDAWEFAIYLPRPGANMPPMALALDVASRTLASAGVRSFVSELEATWPLHAREAHWGGEDLVPGACFYDLRIMPEFAPCYAITDDQLVFGWNSESVELALAGGPPGESRSGNSGLIAHLDRFEEADARLRSSARARATVVPASATGSHPAVSGSETGSLPAVSAGPPPAARTPFEKLELEAVPARDSVELRIRLRAAEMP